jgi:hypothetical protein
MRNSKRIITGAVLVAGLFAFSAPALADWRDQRREYRGDVRDLRNARAELRRDLRRGASPAEIARDRAAIARELRELREHRRDWPRYGQYRRNDQRDYRWHRWNRWNRWDRHDRGWRR